MRLFSLILSITLFSCGFHLRGDYQYPDWFQNVSVMSEQIDIDFTDRLIVQLKQQGVEINQKNTEVSIKINHYKLNKSISKTSKTVSVTLLMSVDFTIVNHGKNISHNAQQQGQYEYQRDNFLADEQLNQSTKEMLFDTIIRELLLKISMLKSDKIQNK